MQRYIITYKTLHSQNKVVVIKSASEYFANIDIVELTKEDGVIEIITIRKLYNPILEDLGAFSSYEISLLENGMHSASKDYDMTITEYNKIAQIYGEELKKEGSFKEEEILS